MQEYSCMLEELIFKSLLYGVGNVYKPRGSEGVYFWI